MGPGVFLLDGVAPLYTPQKMNTSPKDEHVTFKSRRARTRCEISKAELSMKKETRPAQVYQSASTQVVTEFRGPLDVIWFCTCGVRRNTTH